MKNLLTGLFRFARKRVQTNDNDMGMFRDKLTELVEQKDTLSDEDIVKRVEELKGMTSDLPGEDDKAKLDRFLEDFKAVKEQDSATAKEAASMVADLFEKLDTEAMQDVPAVEETEEETETQESELTDGDKEEPAPATPEGEAEDADANSAYTLEEIYQFIKKRMAEDSAACDGADEVETEKEKESEEVTTDHAPFMPVTMNGMSAGKGSLGEMFSQIKNGGR